MSFTGIDFVLFELASPYKTQRVFYYFPFFGIFVLAAGTFPSEVNNRETIAAIEVNNRHCLQKRIEKFALFKHLNLRQLACNVRMCHGQ